MGFRRQSRYVASLHHLAVVFGDFNSRLDLPKDESDENPGKKDESKHKWPAGDQKAWLQRDQVLLGQVSSLRGFREGLIRFPPTYKYKVGTNDLSDTRVPAWCDRVVFKTEHDTNVELLEYDSFGSLRCTSDHHPIAAQFQVTARASASGGRQRPLEAHERAADIPLPPNPSMPSSGPRRPAEDVESFLRSAQVIEESKQRGPEQASRPHVNFEEPEQLSKVPEGDESHGRAKEVTSALRAPSAPYATPGVAVQFSGSSYSSGTGGAVSSAPAATEEGGTSSEFKEPPPEPIPSSKEDSKPHSPTSLGAADPAAAVTTNGVVAAGETTRESSEDTANGVINAGTAEPRAETKLSPRPPADDTVLEVATPLNADAAVVAEPPALTALTPVEASLSSSVPPPGQEEDTTVPMEVQSVPIASAQEFADTNSEASSTWPAAPAAGDWPAWPPPAPMDDRLSISAPKVAALPDADVPNWPTAAGAAWPSTPAWPSDVQGDASAAWPATPWPAAAVPDDNVAGLNRFPTESFNVWPPPAQQQLEQDVGLPKH